jgi:hypothetical protein
MIKSKTLLGWCISGVLGWNIPFLFNNFLLGLIVTGLLIVLTSIFLDFCVE